MKEDSLYLIHIAECIDRIESYTRDGREAFLQDTKTQDAVLRNLHTLAESTQRLSESLKAKHPDVDWRAIAGFRNVVVHDYLGLDVEQIWDIISQDLSLLASQVRPLLKK